MISLRRLVAALTVGAALLATASLQARASSVDQGHLASAWAGVHRGFQAAVEVQGEGEDGDGAGIARALAAIELAIERRAADGRPGRGPVNAFAVLSCKQTAAHPSDCAPGHIGRAAGPAERIAAALRSLDVTEPDAGPGADRGAAGRGNSGNTGGRG